MAAQPGERRGNFGMIELIVERSAAAAGEMQGRGADRIGIARGAKIETSADSAIDRERRCTRGRGRKPTLERKPMLRGGIVGSAGRIVCEPGAEYVVAARLRAWAHHETEALPAASRVVPGTALARIEAIAGAQWRGPRHCAHGRAVNVAGPQPHQ